MQTAFFSPPSITVGSSLELSHKLAFIRIEFCYTQFWPLKCEFKTPDCIKFQNKVSPSFPGLVVTVT